MSERQGTVGERPATGWRGMLAKVKGGRVFLVLGILGVALLLFGSSGILSGGSSEERSEVAQALSAETEAYRLSLSEEIRQLCDAVEGVSETRVLLTLSMGEETVYADDGSYFSAGSNTPVTYIPPQVGGVAIVCRGGSDPVIAQRLIALVSSALGIGSNRVSVAGR